MQGFGRNLKIVAAVHILVVVALSVMSGCSWMRRRKAETIVPIEFTVEVPGPVAPDPAPPVEPDPAPPPPKPEPALPKTRPKPIPEPAALKKPVQFRRGSGAGVVPRVSPRLVRRRLSASWPRARNRPITRVFLMLTRGGLPGCAMRSTRCGCNPAAQRPRSRQRRARLCWEREGALCRGVSRDLPATRYLTIQSVGL